MDLVNIGDLKRLPALKGDKLNKALSQKKAMMDVLLSIAADWGEK